MDGNNEKIINIVKNSMWELGIAETMGIKWFRFNSRFVKP